MAFDLDEALGRVIMQAKAELERLRNEVRRHEQLNVDLATQLAAHVKENDRLRNETAELMGQILSISDLERKVRRLTQENDELRRERTDLPVNQTLVDELVVENADLKQKLEMYAADNRVKAERITALFKQVQEAK